MPGIRSFDEPLDLSVADMSVKVDTPEFSITAWVQVDPGMAVNAGCGKPRRCNRVDLHQELWTSREAHPREVPFLFAGIKCNTGWRVTTA